MEKQIRDLEWWQDIKSNVEKTELVKSLAQFNPKLKDIIINTSHHTVLTSADVNIEKELLGNLLPEDDTAQGRFAILGSVSILDSMKSHCVKPDFKTFSLMLELAPNNLNSEKELLYKIQMENISKSLNVVTKTFDIFAINKIHTSII